MSNASLSQFIEASARIMYADRPDLWASRDEAILDVTTAFSEASSLDDDEECVIHFSGYTLTRTIMDEATEYTLAKKLVGFGVYPEDEDSGTFDWTYNSVAFQDVDLGLPEDELDIEPDLNNDIYYEDPDEQ